MPVVVDAIRIEGPVRTRDFVIRRELGFQEGDSIDSSKIDLAVARLWNTTIFADVAVHLKATVDEAGHRRVTVIVHAIDRWTLNPLFSFGTGGGASFVRVGAFDNNLLGRFLEVWAQYENFDGFHGGQTLFREPRLADQRLELLIQAERLTRPRRGFSDQRTQAIVELARLTNGDRMRFALRARVAADRFLPPFDSPPYFPSPTETYSLEPSFRLGRVDLIRLRYQGVSLELKPVVGAIGSSDVADAYAGLTLEMLWFQMVGRRFNLAARVRGANISKVPPHLELWAGGLDLVRGFPDNFIRSRAITFGNVEARWLGFDSTWVAIMPVAFLDGVAAASPSGKTGVAVAGGAGVRILLPNLVAAGLRVDFAVPLYSDVQQVRLDEQSRFGPTSPAARPWTIQPSIGVYQFF